VTRLGRRIGWIGLCLCPLGACGPEPAAEEPNPLSASVLEARAAESHEHLEDRLSTLVSADSLAWLGEPSALVPASGEGWSVWLDGLGLDRDPAGLVRMDAGEIRILDIDDPGEAVPFGYLFSDSVLTDYIVRFQYRWEGPRFAPRQDRKRDSGFLYHFPADAPHQIWPASVETQVQEDDTGDVHLLWGGDRPSIETTHRGGVYDPAGERSRWSGHLRRSLLFESPDDWNQVEVVVRRAASTHLVNGTANARAFNILSATGEPLTEGRIAFQVEGAQVTYRNLELIPVGRSGRAPRVLVFTGTAGFRHASIDPGVEALRRIGHDEGWVVEHSSDPGILNDLYLGLFDALVLLSTTGDFMDGEQQAALQQFVRWGGGVVSIHGAADAEYEWPWYGQLIGSWFDRHTNVTEGSLVTRLGPQPWREEWYQFRSALPGDADVVLWGDPANYGSEGSETRFPLAWGREFDGGRTWYTALGHEPGAFEAPFMEEHLREGLRFVLRIPRGQGESRSSSS
jgi:type 1 glutamine amidotransferase